MVSFGTWCQCHRYDIAVIPYIACYGLRAVCVEKIDVKIFPKNNNKIGLLHMIFKK